MAIANMFRTLGSGLTEEVRQAKSIIRRVRLTADSSAIGANYRTFGGSFHTYDFDTFLQKAREFYEEGIESIDPLYSVLEMPNHRVAIDYNGEIRGIFTRKGKPLAFFRPDFQQKGYASKSAELADFRQGKNILFS